MSAFEKDRLIHEVSLSLFTSLKSEATQAECQNVNRATAIKK